MGGVSLEEISESTKIGTRSLRALEQEDFEKLPGGIFNKGFVRAYARFLGLDEDQAVSDFDLAWKEHQTANGPPQEIEAEPQKEDPPSSSNLLIGTALVLLLAILGGGYLVKRYFGAGTETSRSSPRESQPALSSPPSVETPSSSTAASPISERTQPPLSERTQPPQAKSEASPPPAEPPISAAAPKTVSPRPPGQGSAGGVIPAPAASGAAILLEVIAHEDSWLSVSADGKSLGQGILNAQKSRTIRANKEVRLRVGNVAGVEVSFNGKPVNIDGEPNQVKELTFTPDGLQQ